MTPTYDLFNIVKQTNIAQGYIVSVILKTDQ